MLIYFLQKLSYKEFKDMMLKLIIGEWENESEIVHLMLSAELIESSFIFVCVYLWFY